MKPPPCSYQRSGSLDETLEALASGGDGVKVLAGGQSLIPLMNMRLARPDRLLDIQAVDELKQHRVSDGALNVGALTTQAALESDPEIADRCPLLAEAIPHVGHAAIRNRGTVGGTIAHADPAAELPVVLTALGGSVTLRKRGGQRTVPADEFFRGFLMTAAEPGELVTEVAFPTTGAGVGTAFEEFARRPGDFALVSIACVAEHEAGTVGSARIAVGGVATTPISVNGLDALAGSSADEAADGAARIVSESVDPAADIHGGSEYRRHLAGELARRAMRRALAQPGGTE